MSQLQHEMHELEAGIDEARKMVERKETLNRLMQNADFKKLIEEDYLREEAIRLSHLMGSPDEQLKRRQEDIENDIRGIASFKRYLSTVIQLGNYAADLIITNTKALDELREGEFEIDDEDQGDDQ
jgi:hypothetical protein